MRSRNLITSTLCLLAVILSACPGLLITAQAQEVPFTGVVVQNQTDVRAGAADRYYRVGELDKGRLVRVDEVIVGWYKIVPPEGFNSYISKAFVDAQGDGSTGVVNTDRSKVYAADINGPAGSYRQQAIVNEGDDVQIVDEEGSHYKIVAPASAYIYLPPGSIRRALTVETAPEEPAEPEEAVEPEPEPQPAPEPVPTPVVVPAEPEPVVVPEPVVEAPAEPEITFIEPEPAPEPVAEPQPVTDNTSDDALSDMLGDDPKTVTPELEPAPIAVELLTLPQLEAKFEAMRALPIEERPLDTMIAQYMALQAKGGLSQPDAYRVRSRLAKLRHDKRIAEGLAAIAQARESGPTTSTQQHDAIDYDAVGVLLASSVYDGKTLPRMFRLVNTSTGRSLAYLRPGGPVDTTQYLGRLVGIKGSTAIDPALKLRVITVELIDPLMPAE